MKTAVFVTIAVATFFLLGCAPQMTIVKTNPDGSTETKTMTEGAYMGERILEAKREVAVKAKETPPIQLSGLTPSEQLMAALIFKMLDSRAGDDFTGTANAVASMINAEINGRYTLARLGIAGALDVAKLGVVAWGITELVDNGSSAPSNTFNLSDQSSMADINFATNRSQIARDAGQVRAFSNDRTNTAGGAQGFGGSSVDNAANASTDTGGAADANLGGVSENAPFSF